MGLRILVLVCAVSLFPAGSLLAQDAPAPPGEPQIRAWIAQLSDEVPEKREEAQQLLIRAGAPAVPLVQAALEQRDCDLETKVRGRRVLDELRWLSLGDVSDLAAVFPPETILLIATPSLKNGLARIRAETPLGKLCGQPLVAPLLDLLWTQLARQMNAAEEKDELVKTWLDRFGGPAGFGIHGFAEDTGRFGEALILGINAPDARKAAADFDSYFPLGRGQATEIERYRGVAIRHVVAQGFSAPARACPGRLVLETIDSRYEVLKPFIDDILDADRPKLAQAAEYREALAQLQPAPLVSLYFSPGNLMKHAGQGSMLGLMFPSFAAGEWKYAAVGLSVEDGLFLERAFIKVDPEKQRANPLFSFAQGSARLAALCPPDALVFAETPVDGGQFYQAFLKGPLFSDPRLKEQFAQAEERLGFNIGDVLAAPVQGEAAFWVTPPVGDKTRAYPELFLVLEARDAAAAQALADGLAKLGVLSEEKDVITHRAHRNRQLHTLSATALGPDSPYAPAWCADGARVLAAGRREALEALLDRLDAKPPGLDADTGFQALCARIPAEERGTLIYLQPARLTEWLSERFGDDALRTAPEDVKVPLTKLRQGLKPLLKDFPGTLVASRNTKDGVRVRVVGGMPVTASVPLLGGLVLFNRHIRF